MKDLLDSLINLKRTKGNFQNGNSLFCYLQENEDFRNTISELSKFFLETRIYGCMSCYMDAYIRLIQLDLDFAKKKLECLFRLPDETVLYLNGNPITNYNLTNELALQYIKENPEEKQRFLTLPSNLEELLNPKENITKKKAEKPKKKK